MLLVGLVMLLHSPVLWAVPLPPPVRDGFPDYHHSAWRVGQGAPGDIWDITQDPAGTLWLATGSGLYRFDGQRFERQDAPTGTAFPSSNMVSLSADPDGGLWIGYYNAGISLWKEGRLHDHGAGQGIPSGIVPRIVRDAEGRLWAAVEGGLRLFDGTRWGPPPRAMGLPEGKAHWLLADSHGTLWVLTDRTIWRLPRGTNQFKATHLQVSQMATLAESHDGQIWLADRLRGTGPIADGSGLLTDAEREARRLPWLVARRLLFARDGALWGTHGSNGGLFRLALAGGRPMQLQSFDVAQGLTSTSAVPIHEDREGNIWVGTNLGLDRFRKHSVNALHEGPSDPYRALLLTSGGHAYGYGEDLRAYDLRRMLVDGGKAAMQASATAAPEALWQFDWGHLWRSRQGRREAVVLPATVAGQALQAMAFPGDDEAWLCAGETHVTHFLQGVWSTEPRLPAQACSVVAMGADGRVLFGYRDGSIRVLERDSPQRYGVVGRPGVGPVTAVQELAEGLLVAGETGVALQVPGHDFQPLRADLPGVLEGVTGIVADPAGVLWLHGSRGLLRVDRHALAQVVAAGTPVTARLFDDVDGMPGIALQSGPVPTAVLAADGLLWLATNQGLAWLDTRLSHRSLFAPGVRIGEISYGNRHQPLLDGMVLPAGTTQLQIEFTARSLARPERNRYRYRLSGVDREWQDAGSSTRAHYTNLAPGSYRFEVLAANEDGLWSRDAALRTFRIQPTFVQTLWFKLLCAAAVLALLVLAVRIRSGQLAALFRARLQERIGERERIARDLHDTLLQGSQGLILRLHAISQASMTPAPVRAQLELAMQAAEQNLAEGRERVAALRDGPVTGQNLATALVQVHEEFAGQGTNPLRLTVEGTPVPMDGSAAEEVFMIGREAIRNALNHADANAIEVELAYGSHHLMLHVRDDGRGMADTHASDEGHWGMQGMRERARRLGGELRVWSRTGLGTEVALSVPAKRIYHRRPAPWWRLRTARNPQDD